MMRPMNGAMGPPGQARQNPIEANRSVMNPTDLAAMAGSGRITPDMTVRDFIENVMGVSVEAPVTELIQASGKQAQNATPLGKAGNIAGGQAPPMGQPPRGQAPMGGAPRQPSGPQGLDRLMGG